MKPDSSSREQELLELLELLENLKSLQAEYPADLRAARREAFLKQVAQHGPAEAAGQTSAKDHGIFDLLGILRSISARYSPHLLAARRAAYRRRIVWLNWVASWSSLYSALQKRIRVLAGTLKMPSLKGIPVFLVLVGLAAVAFGGYLFYENNNSQPQSLPTSQGHVRSGQVLTTDRRMARIVCKPGYVPPFCLAGEFHNNEEDLILPENGMARPAVAKDVLASQGVVHRASHVNDGLYGPGASWVSGSKNSWIKIDLGEATRIDTVTFGRDRLGTLNDGDPGQFVIAVALADNVYADGNSRNDNLEYVPVYRSERAGFSGTITGAETVIAHIAPHLARYLKITFENERTAIDEVEAFLIQPPVAIIAQGAIPGRDRPEEDVSPSIATNISNPIVTNTPVPEATATPIPTSTPVPTNTEPPTFTATPLPTQTFTPLPTSTAVPSDTPIPSPTDTPVVTDTDTPMPTDPIYIDEWPLGYYNYFDLTSFPFP